MAALAQSTLDAIAAAVAQAVAQTLAPAPVAPVAAASPLVIAPAAVDGRVAQALARATAITNGTAPVRGSSDPYETGKVCRACGREFARPVLVDLRPHLAEFPACALKGARCQSAS